MTSLTDRVSALLTCAPQTAADIWDRLGDPAVRLSDVVNELRAMVVEDLVSREAIIGQKAHYRAPTVPGQRAGVAS